MSKDEVKDLLVFIRPYPKEVQELALWLRDWVWDLYPACNELVYDSYNAVAFGWSPTDRQGHSFCSIAVMANYVHFGFYWGSEIADPEKRLQGKGNQYRYIVVKEKADFPKDVYKKTVEGSVCQFIGQSQRQFSDGQRSNDYKSHLFQKKRPGIGK